MRRHLIWVAIVTLSVGIVYAKTKHYSPCVVQHRIEHFDYMALTSAKVKSDSTAIVRGVITGSLPPRWDRSHEFIFTDRTFSVNTWLKGSGPSTITIRGYGGKVGCVDEDFGGQLLAGEMVLCLSLDRGTVLDLEGQYTVMGGSAGINCRGNVRQEAKPRTTNPA